MAIHGRARADIDSGLCYGAAQARTDRHGGDFVCRPASGATGDASGACSAGAATSGVTKGEIEALITKATEDAALAAVEAALLAAPQPVAVAAPVAGAGGQKYGGTLKVGTNDFGTMDPAIMGLSSGSTLYSNLAYDNATVPWYDGSVRPELLESWTISDDVSKYTFKVRQGVRFHHGKLLTADDIAFTYNRILDEATASPIRGPLSFITRVYADGDFTVVFELDGANSFLPQTMSDYHARIVPSDINIEEITSKEFGSGPYILMEHNPAERTVMRRNPDYWRAGLPYIDEIIFFYMPEQTTRLEALKSGAIDVVISPSFATLSELEANPNVHVAETATAGVRAIVMNTSEGIFTDKNLRKALQYGFDRSFVREAALFGRGSNANESPVGVNDVYRWKDQPIIDQDIPLAMEFLAAAGYPDGIDLTLNTMNQSQHLQVALAFKESVAAAGIRINVIDNDTTTYWSEIWINSCCNLVTTSWGGRPAQEAISTVFGKNAAWNESLYVNPRMDELLDLAVAEGDFSTRKAYFQEMQEILIEDVPTIYAMFLPEIVAHRSDIKDVQAHPMGWVFMEDWWIDR